jgi:hypothetical protein
VSARSARAFYAANTEQEIARVRRWQEANPAKVLGIKQRWRAANPLKHAAHWKVAAALRSGKLVREPCAVCGEKAQAHHDNYSKPLDVRWLCREHHDVEHLPAALTAARKRKKERAQ